MKILLDLRFIIFACLTIGLAPFVPEPHIWQKLKWLADGGYGMGGMDYFDVVLHGFPWVLLIVRIFVSPDTDQKNEEQKPVKE